MNYFLLKHKRITWEDGRLGRGGRDSENANMTKKPVNSKCCLLLRKTRATEQGRVASASHSPEDPRVGSGDRFPSWCPDQQGPSPPISAGVSHWAFLAPGTRRAPPSARRAAFQKPTYLRLIAVDHLDQLLHHVFTHLAQNIFLRLHQALLWR